MKIKRQIIIEFDKGEKCFCCDEVFEKHEKVIRTFDSLEEAIIFRNDCNDILMSRKIQLTIEKKLDNDKYRKRVGLDGLSNKKTKRNGEETK